MSNNIIINTNCKNRIKPNLIRDMKTEALLVFARTALERFFKKNKNDIIHNLGTIEDTKFVYESLWNLKLKLEDTVVNVEYLIDLVNSSKVQPELQRLAKYEEPLMVYYDAMAKRIEFHIPEEKVFMPEFLVLCTLSHWVVEEEKSISLYPFLSEFDYLKLIEKFELSSLSNIDDKQNVMEIHRISTDLIETLKRTKYRFNRSRISKTRKKR